MDIKTYITENLPTIINYVLTILAYTLYFIIQQKLKGTKTLLNTTFKEKVEEVKTSNDLSKKEMEQKLKEAEDKYAEAMAAYYVVINDITKLRETLNILTGLEVKNGVPNDRETTRDTTQD